MACGKRFTIERGSKILTSARWNQFDPIHQAHKLNATCFQDSVFTSPVVAVVGSRTTCSAARIIIQVQSQSRRARFMCVNIFAWFASLAQFPATLHLLIMPTIKHTTTKEISIQKVHGRTCSAIRKLQEGTNGCESPQPASKLRLSQCSRVSIKRS